MINPVQSEASRRPSFKVAGAASFLLLAMAVSPGKCRCLWHLTWLSGATLLTLRARWRNLREVRAALAIWVLSPNGPLRISLAVGERSSGAGYV